MDGVSIPPINSVRLPAGRESVILESPDEPSGKEKFKPSTRTVGGVSLETPWSTDME